MAQRQDQSGVFGDGNEFGRADRAARRMAPAQQGLDTGDAALLVEQRLVVHAELVAGLQGRAHIGAQGRAGADGRLHRRIEEGDGVAPRALGLVHGQISLLEQFAHAGRLGAEAGDADADGAVVLVVAQVERLAHACQHLGGHRLGLEGRAVRIGAEALQHDHELVAPDARHGIGLAHAALQALGHALQQQVAARMAHGVVQHLEVVQVDEHQRPGLAGALALGQGGFQALDQQQPVGQLGQRVEERQVVDFFVGLFARGHVAAHRHPVGDLAVGSAHGHRVQVHPVGGAVAVLQQHLASAHGEGVGVRQPGDEFAQGVGAHAMRQHAKPLAHHVLARKPGLPLEGIVDEGDPRLAGIATHGLDDEHDVVQSRDAGLQQHQLLLREAPLGDVAEVHRQAFGIRVGPDFNPFFQCGVEVFELGALVARQRAFQLLLQQARGLPHEPAMHRLSQQFARGVTQQLLAFAVDVHELALPVEGDEGLVDAGERRRQAHGQAHGFFLGLPAGADILHGAMYFQHLASAAGAGLANEAHPAARGVG